MKIRNIISGAALLWAVAAVAAGPCNVPLAVTVDNPDATLSAADLNSLHTRFHRALMAEGFGAPDSTATFALQTSVTENYRDVIPGTRPMVAVIYDADIALVNRLTGETLSRYSFQLKGTGVNDKAARSSAVNSLNPRNNELRRYMGHTDSDIANFYLSQLQTIITRALALSKTGEYQKAMALLSSIPVCINDYSTVQETMETVWQQYLDSDCTAKFALANAAWRSSHNLEGAQLAAAYLAAIPQRSSCNDDAARLMDEIERWITNEPSRPEETEEEDNDESDVLSDLQPDSMEAMRRIGTDYARKIAVKNDVLKTE